MLQKLNAQQIAQAKAIKKKKGRYYTDESFKRAVDGEVTRLKMRMLDDLYTSFTLASALAIKDTLEPTNEELLTIFQRTKEMYEAFNDANCEVDFKTQSQALYEETGILIEVG